MKSIKTFFFCWCIFFSLHAISQKENVTPQQYTIDTAKVNSLLQQSKTLLADNPDEAIRVSMQAKEFSVSIGFDRGLATALKTTGNIYYNQAKHIEAIAYWNQALQVFQRMNDDIGIANILSNIGVVHMDQGDDEKALKYFLQSLKVAEKTGDKLRIITAMNNVGAVYYHKKETHDRALHYYNQALALSEEIGDNYGIGTTAVNLGEIYFERKDSKQALFFYQKSLKAYRKGSPESMPYSLNAIGKVYASEHNYKLAISYHTQALALSKKLNSKLDISQAMIGMAKVYEKQEQYKTAINYFESGEKVAKEINALHELQQIYQGLATAYAKTGSFQKAFTYQTLFTDTKSALYNIDADKKLASMQFDFDLQKKQGEINLLTKDKALKEVQLNRQRLARNGLAAGLVLIFLIAALIYRNYRIKAKTNKILDRQNAEIEGLILNILPAEVAKELQSTGVASPKHYESVSVMFTDFKGFTSLSDKMSPDELVEELSTCFIAFDNIIEKHNLEKIKTIGDSYMCAGGIPTPDNNHAFNMIEAGLEIQEYINDNNNRRAAKGLPPWDIRIGIHIGPVVAGVVGKKKYAYDIWGSTVNIASRMESNGAAGEINISAPMYEIVKERFRCVHRGKIYAKNVGDIDMYFVQNPKLLIAQNTEQDIIMQQPAKGVLKNALVDDAVASYEL